LAEYGLSGAAPTGATNITSSVATVGGHSLTIYFTGSSANDVPIKTWFASNGWTFDYESSGGGVVGYFFSKSGFVQASYTRNDTACQIQSVKD
jgi:hypothetical protein